jgi:polyhydroxyalkanoate synthesis regulator phasin
MGDNRLRQRWVLLIYAVPASPSRKRAAVWREVKRLGAHYLRDGVCVLPDTEPARAALGALCERVIDLGGQGTLVREAQLAESSAEALLGELARARQAEYAEIETAASDLLHHLQQEAQHHHFGRSELVSLLADLSRLERWLAQIVARDYLHQGDPAAIVTILATCRTMLETHASPAAQRAVQGES